MRYYNLITHFTTLKERKKKRKEGREKEQVSY